MESVLTLTHRAGVPSGTVEQIVRAGLLYRPSPSVRKDTDENGDVSRCAPIVREGRWAWGRSGGCPAHRSRPPPAPPE